LFPSVVVEVTVKSADTFEQAQGDEAARAEETLAEQMVGAYN
jgi:hypothetical protein